MHEKHGCFLFKTLMFFVRNIGDFLSKHLCFFTNDTPRFFSLSSNRDTNVCIFATAACVRATIFLEKALIIRRMFLPLDYNTFIIIAKMALKRFGVSLEEEVSDALDQYVIDNGFPNRSQAIRFLIEKNVAEKKWMCNHIVAGTIIIMYDQDKKEISTKIGSIEQNYQDAILSSSQYFINKNFCLHIATVMGEAHRLTELADKLTAIKGIKHGKLVMSRAD